MSEENINIRISKVAKEFNVGVSTIIEFLAKKGHKIDPSPNTKINKELYALLEKEYRSEKEVKMNSEQIFIKNISKKVVQKNNDNELEEEKLSIKTNIIENAPETSSQSRDYSSVKKVEEPELKQEKKQEEVVSTIVEPVKVNEPVTEVKEEVKLAPVSVVRPVAEPKQEPVQEKTDDMKPDSVDKVTQMPTVSADEYKDPVNNNVSSPDDNLPVQDKAGIQVTIVGKIDLPNTKKDKKGNEHKSDKSNDDGKKPHNQHNNKGANDAKKEHGKDNAVNKSSLVKPNDKHNPIDNNKDKKEHIPAADVAATKQEQKQEPVGPRFIGTVVDKLEGPKIVDKIDLPDDNKKFKKSKPQPVVSSSDEKIGKDKKKKRKRIDKKLVDTNDIISEKSKQDNKGGKQQGGNSGKSGGKPNKGDKNKSNRFGNKGKNVVEEKVEVSEEDIQKQIKETLARLSAPGKSKTSKHRREKRQSIANEMEEERMHEQEEKKILKVTEFVTANELATMMNIPVTKVISTCMTLGVFVSINQRLDAEILSVVAEEFGFKVEFTSIDVQEAIAENDEPDRPEDMVSRAPIVTVMGHVDHGKTKLLDFIRHSNVVAGEAGGITQHIGAYEVRTESGKKIIFLDTPGHEAFTAMRARGAKLTDVAIIVIAADDSVMPQTVEAINHAQAADVPIVFAINKIDKPTANPQKIYEQLAQMNILVEEWGGKYQSQEISAKMGLNVDKLLEKVLLEAELLDLKGNPNRLAKGTIIESALDKGRGYVAKVLVQDGTLRIGDIVLAGTTYGRVKAMFNERNQLLKEAGPSTPLLLLGLNGAPQAGDNFNVMSDEKEVKSIASRRQQLQREQGLRTQKHITLDEIGRRIAIGDFKELNIIVKADVDGSVEALSDSLLKLSTNEVQVNVIHKSVGAISESDIMLASASNAIIVGFNVRPTLQARRIAEREQIDIRLYSIIYQAIEEIKAAIEGMLAPKMEEVVTCNIEIREVFNISKVGRIAGCLVLDGKVNRQTKIRIIRDGIVVHTGTLGSLKRFKDDVKEVSAGYECGLNILDYNDIKVGDIIEGYTEKEVARKL
ncbi:MAG TPA: translation initiation factor IF-2 [Bacteroidetes bacterium]|nr:translation initiation factor IF-2 [Candidatus Limimorpha avicola]